MRVLRDPSAADAISHPELRMLVQQRFTQLSQEEPYDPDVYGYFIALEDGDSLDLLTGQLGFSIMTNRFDGTHFGDEGFMGMWEILEEHTSFYEFVFVLGDDGYGVLVFVPKSGGIPPGLLAMCRQYATKYPVKAQEGPSP
ncbi:MAG: hypothetical protein V4451_17365 [Pseudomonadota bacterium]